MSSPRSDRKVLLASHPTVKPITLVDDALLDCSNRYAIVLDPFDGSGSTLIAAERTNRQARLIELSPTFVDVIITRFLLHTRQEPIHELSGRVLSAVENDILRSGGTGRFCCEPLAVGARSLRMLSSPPKEEWRVSVAALYRFDGFLILQACAPILRSSAVSTA